MATTYHNALQQLYVAYFNRPADKAGLDYWEGILEANGGNTAVVSASFAASPEYKAEYADMGNAAIVNQIYLNLFSRPAEPEGLVYWTNLLNAGTTTIDDVVTVITKAALANNGTDAVAFNSKVAVATAFTNALTAEQATAYNGDLANEAAKELLSTIKTAADVTAATAPAKLAEHIDAVVDAATPFTLASGLAALQATQEARAEFLAGADGDDDAETTETEASLKADVDTAQGVIAGLVTGYDADRPAVAAALLAEEIAARAAALEADQETYAEAIAEADDVDGLVDAIAALEAAIAAQEDAGEAEVTATASLDAALSFYNTKNAEAKTVGPDGTVAGLIVLNASGALVLAPTITEANEPGVTALLNAAKALEAAEDNTEAADAAVEDAQFVVDILDLTDSVAARTELADVGAGFTITTPAKATAPTPFEILNERTALQAAVDAAAPADVAAKTTALNNFNTLVGNLVAADPDNELSGAVAAAALLVEAEEANVKELADAVAALNEASALVAEYDTFNAEVTAALAEFTEAGLKTPVTLGLTNFATAGNDIFVVGDAATTKITGFGDAGVDHLFVGTGYTLSTSTTFGTTVGNSGALEVFLIQSGADVKVYVEDVAFGSQSAAEAEQIITLTGVQVSELTFANGIITAA